MTPDELAFITAICADPADDTARLVYADWLEEYGGRPERAEFIRVQCWLSEWERVSGNRMIAGPEIRRQQSLLHDHEWEWCHAICPELHRGSYDTEKRVHHWLYPRTWSRGFLDTLELPANEWLNHGDEITSRLMPSLTVTLKPSLYPALRWDADEDAAWFSSDPKARRIHWVDIYAISDPIERDARDLFRAFLRLRWPRATITIESITESMTALVEPS